MENSGDSKDIRQVVDSNKSFLKKIQSIIPGFSGYRQNEDIRVADELLRSQISGILNKGIDSLNLARQSAVNFGKFSSLNYIANSISVLQTFTGDILHGEQGYSGIAPAIKINATLLDRIYEYDFAFVLKCKEIRELCDKLVNIGTMMDTDILNNLNSINSTITDAKNAWSRRMETIEGVKE
jgi:hypothetical protein